MPELPEVENFRRRLLPLISDHDKLFLERGMLDRQPPRKFLSDQDIASINTGNYRVADVIRKGKQLCMVLQSSQNPPMTEFYLMLHMGMTGRISTPACVPKLESQPSMEYPPGHTYLILKSGTQEACFSDPRKFGSVLLETALESGFMGSLAPDAMNDLMDDRQTVRQELVLKLTGQSMGIKALLLDQKRVVSGVGNWVADEVLYQMKVHPDQNYLSKELSHDLLVALHEILTTAVMCLSKDQEFPKEWLFHFRWNSRKVTKDYHGRTVTFVTSGGRTSAVVPSIQKKKGKSTGVETEKRNANTNGNKKRNQTVSTTSKGAKKVKTILSPDKDQSRKPANLSPAKTSVQKTKPAAVASSRRRSSRRHFVD